MHLLHSKDVHFLQDLKSIKFLVHDVAYKTDPGKRSSSECLSHLKVRESKNAALFVDGPCNVRVFILLLLYVFLEQFQHRSAAHVLYRPFPKLSASDSLGSMQTMHTPTNETTRPGGPTLLLYSTPASDLISSFSYTPRR